MKQLLIGTGLFFCASCIAVAGQKVDETLKAAEDGYVEIEHLGGYAKITGWDKNEVHVKGELGENTDEFIFERDGNEVVVRVKVKKRRGGWSNWNDDYDDNLEIFIPKNSRLSYTSTNAEVEASKVFGGADIETVNGDIKVDKLSGRLMLEAVNGDIDAKELKGDVKIETVNGDIRSRSSQSKDGSYESVNGNIDVVTDSPELSAETVNGDIELDLGNVEQLNLNTVNGSIEAKLELAKQGDVRATSVGGSIELYFQEEVSARFDIQGHAGGRIVNKLSDHAVKKAKYGPSRWLEFSLNGGDGKVDVSTVSGRVKLGKK